MAAANGLLAVLRAWSGAGDTQEVLSVGVPCTGRDVTADSCGAGALPRRSEETRLPAGHYGVPEGVVLSVPAAFREGKCSLLSELSVGDKLKERIQLSLDELLQEKKLAEGNN